MRAVRFAVVIALVAGLPGCATTGVLFEGHAEPRMVRPGELSEVETLPEGYERIGRLRARCTLVEGGAPRGGSYSQSQRAEQRSAVATGGSGAGLAGAAPQYVVYRVSIRAFGPRGTESFFQTTYGCCDD